MRTRSEPENRGNVKTLSKAFLLKWALKQKTDDTHSFTVLLTLVACADGKGQCNVSINHLSRTTKLSRSAVIRALNKLDGACISREEKQRGNRATGTSVTTLKIGSHRAHSRCQSDTRGGVSQTLGGECQSDTPLVYLETNSTRKDRLVLEDRYHLDNRPEYLGEGGSEGGVGPWWWGPADGPLLCNGYDDEVPA